MQNLGCLLENRKNNFNLIRLFAAISVIYGHTSAVTGKGPDDFFLQYVGFKFIGGIAVDVFFIISGFFITSSYINSKNIKYFIASRILRIYPALVICVAITAFVVGPIYTQSAYYFFNTEVYEYFFTNASAYNTVYFLPGVFENLHDKAINGSLWSIPIEVKLYCLTLIFGMFYTLAHKNIFNFIFFIILIVAYFNSSIFSIFFQYENHRHVALMFLMGSFIYVNKDKIILNPFMLLLLLFLAASFHGTEKFEIVYNLLLPYIVIYLGFAKEIKIFNKIGDYSYGIYLYGWIIQQLVFYYNPQISNQYHAIVSIISALIAGVISWHLIESKMLKFKKRFL